MNKLYDSRLREILDELYLKTSVAIPWSAVYIWFGTQKIAKTPYRHIQREWEKVCDSHKNVWPQRDKSVKIQMVQNAGFDGLVITRELFDDEISVQFDQLTA